VAGELPALRVGSLPSASACRRRLAHLLDPETKPRPPAKGAFRLDTAVREAIRVAHDVADQQATVIADTIDLTPPPGLSAEERARFVRALENYVEMVGDDEVSLHPSTGEFLERPSRTERFRLTGRNDTTVVGRHDDVVEVRRLHLGGWKVVDPSEGDDDSPSAAIDDDALLALLITKGQPWTDGELVARVRHLWLGPEPRDVSRRITVALINAAGRQLTTLVESSLADPAPTPGWWCDGCSAVKSCPSVASFADHELLNRLPAGA
jgi:hypothetical protein